MKTARYSFFMQLFVAACWLIAFTSVGKADTAAAPTFSPAAGYYTTAQTVAISSTTSGASIRYTTDGSAPSDTAGTLYTGPVTISATTTLKAVAFASGLTNSSVSTANYYIMAAAPTFSPAAGYYTTAQTVAISSTTSGASIRYTTDGSVPSDTAGTLYTGPVTISATTTLKAVAFASGLTNSSVSTANYYIMAAAPTFSPAAGYYTTTQTVTIGSTTSGASICYTTDGSAPSDTAGTLYTGPVTISATTTLKAAAYASGLTNSSVSTANYYIMAAAPTFSPAAGYYTTAQTVTISSTTSGASIRYTTDGSAPSDTAGTLYAGPITVSATTTLKAVAYASGLTNSSVSTANYYIMAAAPTFSPAAGYYTTAQTVAIGSTTGGASIRYTTDGSAPSDTAGTLYTGPVTISATTTLKAIAFASGLTNSSVSTANYYIMAAAPTFSPAAGYYTTAQTVTIGSSTSGASIRYTTDGSTPSDTAGTLYAGPITVSGTTTLKAVAFASGLTNSSVSTANYYIMAAAPTFSPAAGYYTTAQTVTIGSSTSGASIRYTTDGSTPSDTAGTLYAGPITVSGTTTLKAVAFASGLTNSSVSTANYYITGGTASISGLSPTSGPVGTAVTITGSNFGASQGSSTVTFNGVSAGTASGWSATSITATVPYGASTGNVVVTVNGASSSGVAFTVTTPPAISSLSPLLGPVGTAVTIIGRYFGATQGSGTVTFNGVGAAATSWSDASITVAVPSGASSGNVVVTVSGTASNGKSFRVGGPPTITNVSPTSGEAGTQVTITGSGFGSVKGNGTVWLGSTYGTAVSWSDTAVVATVASNSTSGIARVRQDEIWSNDVPFNVNTATISTVSPASGVAGTEVTITGTGFGSAQGTSQVSLGTSNGVVQSWSDTQIVAQVAAGSASGNARVLRGGVWSNAVAFTVPALHIANVSPTSGASGTSVTITGTGFGSSQSMGSVQLGSTAGQVVSWSDTQVVATVAPASLSGVVCIQQNGARSNAVSFTVPSGGNAMTLVPNIINLTVGDTRAIQALNDAGQPVTGLTWTSSDTNVVSLSGADPPVLTAVAAGHATITAGTASADVTVVAGALPLGTVIWSNPGSGGGVYAIVPAVPSPTGVADVFAFQNDGTVQAITSEGATAWTADVSQAWPVLPDFQGGLVAHDNDSIVKFDGITGQRTILYTPNGDTSVGDPLVHTDGTIFATQDTYSNDGPTIHEVIGLDPDTGARKFTVPMFDSPNGFDAVGSGAIIAGDGYAYVPYQTMRLHTNNVWHPCDYHIGLKRISSSGTYSDIPIYDWTGECNEIPTLGVNMITNADTGVLMSWSWTDMHYNIPTEFRMAVTNGTSATMVSAPQVAGDDNWPIAPMLQTQEGWFVGSIVDGSYNYQMVAFEANGNVRWIVPGYQPKIATEDGGVIATADDGSAVTFDQNGGATGQMASLSTQSWLANTYRIGSVDQDKAIPFYMATTFWPVAFGNPAMNLTAVKASWFPPLEHCTTTPGCVGPHEAIYNALDDLVARLTDPTVAARAQTHVFSKIGTDSEGVPLTTDGFRKYLTSKRPGFYDGIQSTYCKDALDSDIWNPVVNALCWAPTPNWFLTSVKYFLASVWPTADAIVATPHNPLRVFFRPSSILYASLGKNLGNEGMIFHEALHGISGKDNGPILDKFGWGMTAPSCNISKYIELNVLTASPGLNATTTQCCDPHVSTCP